MPRTTLDEQVPHPTSIIFSLEPKVDLRDFDYDRIVLEAVEPRLEAIKRKAKLYNRAVARLMSAPDTPLSLHEILELEESASHLGQVVVTELEEIIDALNEVTRHLAAHTRDDFTSEAIEEYLLKSSHRLKNLAWHADTNKDIDQLRSRYDVFNGHVAYYGTDPLRLDLQEWRGLTIFSTQKHEDIGEIVVEGITRMNHERDRVLIHANNALLYGNRRIEAAIYVEERLRFAGEVDIVGNLVINELKLRQDRHIDEDLRGTVTYDPGLRSGGFLRRAKGSGSELIENFEEASMGHYTIGMAPRSKSPAVIFRSPTASGQPEMMEEL